MWQTIVKSKLTTKAKALLISKYINQNIIKYEETISHDGNIGEDFESDIYTLKITIDNNTHIYIMENWFHTKTDYYLFEIQAHI